MIGDLTQPPLYTAHNPFQHFVDDNEYSIERQERCPT